MPTIYANLKTKKSPNLRLSFMIFMKEYYFILIFLANKVFCNSIAMVIGPTPPGTGVMNDDFLLTPSKSTSPVITYPFG
jgi:hypothetical protein